MNEVVNEKVSVITVYNREKGSVMPYKMRWQGRSIFFTRLTYYHRVRKGRSIFHIFHVTDNAMDFRLSLDGELLHWTLEEVCDGTPS